MKSPMPNKAIHSFSGEYRFLSNFFPSPVDLDGIEYPTVEHAYQAAKTLDLKARTEIRFAPSARQAKRLGSKVKLRHNWEKEKYPVMVKLLYQKFRVEPLRTMLMETGDAELVEGNTWGDTYWGVCNGVGKNILGRLLMTLRKSLDENGEVIIPRKLEDSGFD
jgi:ribA/ribD-fused uncharacterized protein